MINFFKKSILLPLAALVLGIAFSYAHAATIRNYNPANTKDFKAILSICAQHHKAFGECKECGGEFMTLLYALSTRRDLPAWIKVIEDNNTVIGFIIYAYTILGADLPSQLMDLSHDLNLAELSFIGIDTNHQGKGYGHALWQAALQDITSRGFSGVIARISEDNTQAIRWHEKEGFQPITESASILDIERVLGQARGQPAFILPLNDTIKNPRFFVLTPSIKAILYPEITINAEQRAASGYAQCFLAEIAAHDLKPASFSDQDAARIIQHYLVSSFDEADTEKFAAFLLGVKRLRPESKNALHTMLEYVKDNLLPLQREALAQTQEKGIIRSYTCGPEGCSLELKREQAIIA
jgi:ribosomal protein S18 acetylase RimI-like enzyme